MCRNTLRQTEATRIDQGEDGEITIRAEGRSLKWLYRAADDDDDDPEEEVKRNPRAFTGE